MSNFIAAVALVAIALMLAKASHLPAFRGVRRLWRSYGFVLGVLLALVLAMSGRFAIAVTLILILAGLYREGILLPRTSAPSSRKVTVLKAHAIALHIDEATDRINGRVLEGKYRGQALASLEVGELASLYRSLVEDRDSRTVLEIYLDRRVPGWRQNTKFQTAARSRRPADSGTMSEEEAYEVLGLQKGAGETEIRSAHRRLMMRAHPDRGGSNVQAVRINQAKDRLLSKHR